MHLSPIILLAHIPWRWILCWVKGYEHWNFWDIMPHLTQTPTPLIQMLLMPRPYLLGPLQRPLRWNKFIACWVSLPGIFASCGAHSQSGKHEVLEVHWELMWPLTAKRWGLVDKCFSFLSPRWDYSNVCCTQSLGEFSLVACSSILLINSQVICFPPLLPDCPTPLLGFIGLLLKS